MRKISVFEYSGKYATDEDPAIKLYEEIARLLTEEDELIVVDFAKLKICSCKFFSYSICQLYKDWSVEVLNQRIELVGMSPFAQGTWDLVAENARKFYGVAA